MTNYKPIAQKILSCRTFSCVLPLGGNIIALQGFHVAKFIFSHRLANRKLDFNRVESRGAFETASASFAAFAQVHTMRSPKQATARGLMIAEGDPKDFEAKRKEAPADLIIEPQVPRRPRLFTTQFAPMAAAATAELGLGTSLNLTCMRLPRQ
jgi:hypothetical protein